MGPIVETEFTPWASLFGGVLIGLSAVLVMLAFGRIAGIVGITSGALSRLTSGQTTTQDWAWRVAFVLGLIAAPLLMQGIGQTVTQTVPSNLLGMVAAGLIVGVGTAMGSGCTSGHGVCGLARLSPRSLAAVLTFMATAGITVYVLRHVIGV
ncbi:MAG: YeeE/YedE family protein [Pseudomonadota bacterium]